MNHTVKLRNISILPGNSAGMHGMLVGWSAISIKQFISHHIIKSSSLSELWSVFFTITLNSAVLVYKCMACWWMIGPQVELNFLLSFLSTCYLSSTSFYLSSTPFCVPVFIQLCLAWNQERVALQLRAPPIDE